MIKPPGHQGKINMLLRQLFEEINKPAVLGWGRGMGHKGHMLLAKAVIHHAQENNAKAYFVVSRTSLVDPATGEPWADRPTFTKTKDDPLSPEEKLATYRKVFPQDADVFSVATADASTLDKVLGKIARDGFTKVTLIVGELEKDSFSFLTRPDKSGIPPYQKAGLRDLEIISRQDTSEPSSVKGSPDYQEGPRATPMRTVLTDPSKSEEEQFAVWRDAMPDNLSDDEVMDLMNKAKQRMAAVPAAKNAKKAKQAVAEGSDPNKLAASVTVDGELKEFDLTPFIVKNNWVGDPKTVIKQADKWLGDFLRSKGLAYSNLKISYKGIVMNASQTGDVDTSYPELESMAGVAEVSLGEGPSLPSTLKSIATNGEPITQLYGKLQAMAKRWVDNNGSLKGFHRNAAGQSAQWFNNFYFNKLQADLYALTKQAPRHAAPLIMFLKDASEDRESRINFTEISRSLPPILFRMGKKIDDESLARFAASWDSRRKEYESYLADLESQADDEDDFDEPVVKPEKSKMPGQQNAQAEQIVNDILSKLPKNVAGDIRNAIARAPNKLQALHQELSKRKIQGVAENKLGNVLPWPEVVNKVSSAMKATGWKGKRMSDDAFMFTTRGAEVEDQWYIAIIDNAGEGFFRYALGTVEEGDPHIDDAYRGKLPNTEASVSELINEIREGFGLA